MPGGEPPSVVCHEHPVAVGEADLQLGGVREIRALVDVVALVDRLDDRAPVFGIGHRQQPRGQRRPARSFDSSGATMPWPSRPLRLMIHLPEPHGVRRVRVQSTFSQNVPPPNGSCSVFPPGALAAAAP